MPVTRATFAKLHGTLPKNSDEAEDAHLVSQCYFYELYVKARAFRMNPPQRQELEAAVKYVFEIWPSMDEERKELINKEVLPLF